VIRSRDRSDPASRKSTSKIAAPSHPVATMPSGYASRDVGDPSQVKKNKQSMADLKLRRLTELNNRLREDLERDRIPVSQASNRYRCPPLEPWLPSREVYECTAQ
jgi:guanine nucleotide-binding protein subunit gamma, fungi